MLLDFAISLIGELPPEFTFVYGIFILLFLIPLVIMCLFPIVAIFKLID